MTREMTERTVAEWSPCYVDGPRNGKARIGTLGNGPSSKATIGADFNVLIDMMNVIIVWI
jgi:hypothetical protein